MGYGKKERGYDATESAGADAPDVSPIFRGRKNKIKKCVIMISEVVGGGR
jgi:hypothetical protein